MEKIFNLTYREVTNIIKEILKKELHLDNNVNITYILGYGDNDDDYDGNDYEYEYT